jgi:hypothetical protein
MDQTVGGISRQYKVADRLRRVSDTGVCLRGMRVELRETPHTTHTWISLEAISICPATCM